MGRYVIGRLLATIPVMIVASLVIFSVLRLTPGDPALMIAGEMATTQEIDAIRQSMGLDQSLPAQFLIWLGHVAQGDLGKSTFNGQPVARLLLQRAEPTVLIALLTLSLSLVISLALGITAAQSAGGLADRMVTGLSVLGFSVPPFVVAYGLVFFFSLGLGWTPVQGYKPLSSGVGPWLTNLALPIATLSTGYVALMARVVRTSLLEVLGEDHVRTARAKGLTERVVLTRHGLLVAAVPIVTVTGTGLALLLGGVVVTESVFNLPGIGRLTVDAIAHRDYPIIQGVVLVFSAIYVLVNLLIDLSYAALDPRIRYR